MTRSDFDAQFDYDRDHYLSNLDMVTWIRHYYVLRDVLASSRGDVLEIGTGDGIVRRCVQPFVTSYKVLDINPKLEPDFLGDLRDRNDNLVGTFDLIVITEVLEHLPFGDLDTCLGNLWAWLRPGGRMLVSVPHRRSSVAVLTPGQKLLTFRFPNGLLRPSEFYNRFIRGRIWIDPNHRWEIGDGRVGRADVEERFATAGFSQLKRSELPYSDYWVLVRQRPAVSPQS